MPSPRNPHGFVRRVSALCLLILSVACSPSPRSDPADRLLRPMRTTITWLGATGVLQTRTYRTLDINAADYPSFYDPTPLARLRAMTLNGAEVAFQDRSERFRGAEGFRRLMRRSDGLLIPDAMTPLGPVAPFDEDYRPFDPGFGGPSFLTIGAFHSGERVFGAAFRSSDCTDGCRFEDRWRPTGADFSRAAPQVVSPALEGCTFVVRYLVCDVPPDVLAIAIEERLGDGLNFFVVFDLAAVPSEPDPQRCLDMRITDQRTFEYYSQVDVNTGACMERIRDRVFRSRSERPPVEVPGSALTEEG